MNLDDRMKNAFNERTTSLETTMTPTNPLETSAPTAKPTSIFNTALPWIAAAVGALVIVLSVVAINSGGDDDAVTDNPLTTTETETETEKATPTTAQAAAQPDDTSTSGTVPDGESKSSLPFQQGDDPEATTCTVAGYTVTIPKGWFHDNCAPFSPAAIQPPGPHEFRPEINLSYDGNETYAKALIRINATLTVLSTTSTTVDGHTATLFTLEEEWYDVGQRTLYVVDGGGSGVFFASGNELVDSGAVFADRADHYNKTLTTLHTMLATVDVTYSSPVQKTKPVCAAPTFNNPSTGPTIQADIDGDGQTDTVEMVHHDAGTSIVADAGTNGFYATALTGANFAHISNEIIAVDLDANGVMEILASVHSGAAGNDYQSFFLNGCDLTPIGGATPAVIQRATVTNVNSFECSFGAHGNVQLDTVESVYDSATSDYDHTTETFNFDGTDWVSLASNSSTSANPTQLPGPSTCE